jgi:hypothetical protein
VNAALAAPSSLEQGYMERTPTAGLPSGTPIDAPSGAVGAVPLVVPHMFRTNARIYASQVTQALLADVVAEPRVAVLVDVDALERTRHARIDRVMLLALDALGHLDAQIILLARRDRERAEHIHRELPRSWHLVDTESRHVLAQCRERSAGVPLVAITDDRDLLGDLLACDRGIALGNHDGGIGANIATTGDVHVRAMLWWIVDERWKARTAAWR